MNETVILTLKRGPNYALGSPASATVTITSDEPITRKVTVTASDNTATEAGLTTGTFTFTRTGSLATALTLTYGVTGTATAGSDYLTLGTGITFPIGKSTVTKTVTPKQDTLAEPNETVILTLKQSPLYAVGSPASGTIVLSSDD